MNYIKNLWDEFITTIIEMIVSKNTYKVYTNNLGNFMEIEMVSYNEDRFGERISMCSKKDELIEQIFSFKG